MKIVEAGNRGALLNFGAVDTSSLSLKEDIHFVIPIRDNIVQMEDITQKKSLKMQPPLLHETFKT
ncbi:MAG: hypothetical protein M3270_07660 [Thermoproteota archaeon]|nr:hypothetical protein [Thermoproteota archaeon]